MRVRKFVVQAQGSGSILQELDDLESPDSDSGLLAMHQTGLLGVLLRPWAHEHHAQKRSS